MEEKILMLVNSNESLMYITKKMLEHCGYSVCCATDLDKVWKMIKHMSPDGIVLDNEILDYYGFEYCRELREKIGAPIMFISANPDDELPAIDAGADDFMIKPLDYEILKARVRAMLQQTNKGETKQENARGISRKHIMDDEVRYSAMPRRKTKVRRVINYEQMKKNRVAMCISMGTVLACFTLAALTVGGTFVTGSGGATRV